MIAGTPAHPGEICWTRGHRYDVMTNSSTSWCYREGCGRVFVTEEGPDLYTGPNYSAREIED